MFCNENMNNSTLFLFIIAIYAFHLCGSMSTVSRGGSNFPHGNQESASTVRGLVKQYTHRGSLDSQLAQGRKLRESEASYVKHLSKSSKPEDDKPVTQNIVSWSWTNGTVTTQQRVAHTKDGFQGDVAGFHGVHGKALVPSSVSFPHVSEWLAMNPVLMCYHDAMTFTAYRQAFTQLFVDTGRAYPLSLLQLPPNCGYTVRTSSTDLQMIVPYDACYITQENGSYVLPMLWWNSPLKLVCPAQISTPVSMIPDILCSPYGMAVQLYQQEKDLPMLGVLVNGVWAQFVSTQCAYRVDSQQENLIFFVSFIAPCITIGDRLQVQLVFDKQEIILSCPVPSTASPSRPDGTRHIPVHPAVPQYPTESAAATQEPVPPSPSKPTPPPPSYHCEVGSVVVFLPTAHPHLIQVKDQERWQSLSSVCGHKIHKPTISTVILYSPLPGCHTKLLSPMVMSLSVRYLDFSSKHYLTMDLQCPYQSSTPPPVTPSTPPTQFGKILINRTAPLKPKVFCSSRQMLVELPPGPISGIVLKDAQGKETSVQDVPQHCGYSANMGKDGKIHLRLQLHTSCQMSVQDNMYIITVAYMTQSRKTGAQFYCPVSNSLAGQECSLPSEQRLPCGQGPISQPSCLSMGCCFSKNPPVCYYPIDECTIDRHFVFSVPASLTEPPLSPSLLVVANNSTCKPVKATSEYALFKLPMDGCGARRMEMGKSLIYMVEVVNMVQTISLNYGTITRDSPVRLLVECRYVPGSVRTVSYLVKTPTLGPTVQTQGVFGVQLRLAKDAQYTSYYPQYHQPLQMLLGKPLYLEVRMLNAPDPSLVLLVHYCVAYPRSGKAVWVLLYNGCPNPLDPATQHVVLSHPQPPSPQGQTRRFTMSTFQFLPDDEIKDPDEEIYFMCSTEVCSPRDGPCVEGCFGQ
uniref:uncharacterized protein LOC131100911 isoform X2 n=1 Tax=Doryrhamphus excisus TaxID=161450 RepID=UPI0025AE7836|nr:uncharacterized protein LOC131100911 isoform X2 [Doryrhamphus excisus]